jgi:dihydrolipoamide dehydrogenase
LAISAELTYEEIGATIHPHPTISESIMEAAHDLSGHAIHKI